MNGAVPLDGRLGPDGKPMTVDSLDFKKGANDADNVETIKEGGINDVKKALKEGLSKDEAIKEGMGEKDIVDKGLEDNENLKDAQKNGGVGSKKDGDDVDESGMAKPDPSEEKEPPYESSQAQKKSVQITQLQTDPKMRQHASLA